MRFFCLNLNLTVISYSQDLLFFQYSFHFFLHSPFSLSWQGCKYSDTLSIICQVSHNRRLQSIVSPKSRTVHTHSSIQSSHLSKFMSLRLLIRERTSNEIQTIWGVDDISEWEKVLQRSQTYKVLMFINQIDYFLFQPLSEILHMDVPARQN